jgi:hypothetical protein
MEELSKTYTLTDSRDGGRINFGRDIALDLRLEPHHTLFEVIDRVETLYPQRSKDDICFITLLSLSTALAGTINKLKPNS